MSSSQQIGICYQWRDTGTCRFGNRCQFRHVGRGGTGVAGGGGGRGGQGRRRRNRGGRGGAANSNLLGHNNVSRAAAVRQSQVSRSGDDLKRMIKHLSVLADHKLGPELQRSEVLWHRCWESHKTSLDDTNRRLIVEILAKIPGSSALDPPSIELCEEVMTNVLDRGTTKGTSNDDILTVVKTVFNALDRLIRFEWNASRDQVRDGLTNIAFHAESKLQKRDKSHRDVAAMLIEKVEDFEKEWRIRIKAYKSLPSTDNDSVDLEIDTSSYAAWKTADVKWLCDPKIFSPSCCPMMKVGKHGVYDSAEEYMDTVLRLWVAMTFSDGHSSMAPHCRSRGSNGACQKGLLPIADSKLQNVAHLRCRTQGCSRHVEFACRIQSHDALCGPCAARSIQRHMGGPGKSASTHVYDCKVKDVDPDGILYLHEFKSRSPPPNAIHWRTTRRLSAPNLVGVVKLRSKGASLAETDPIKWGEITFHGQSFNEDKRRQNGELAINLSSIVDFEQDYFAEGKWVAVIDCMTFVPEWIPVLKALESQKGVRLPFEKGKYLNLWKEDPVTTTNTVLSGSSADAVFASDRLKLIEKMVDESQLEPIKEVRRDESLKDRLIAQLEGLVTETTLDKMQLVSFVDALRNPVHLTQGPPGTGKSYLGVVLVRALMIIRDLWVRKSSSVRNSPILVLSYKNHAIDEFLVDLINAEPLALSRGKMIRIGGQCKDPRLQYYSEKSVSQSDLEVRQRRKVLESLHVQRESILAIRNGNVASFMSFRHALMYEHDPATRRKTANNATDSLMESLSLNQQLEDVLEVLSKKDSNSSDDIASMMSFVELDRDGKFDRSGPIRSMAMNPDGSSFIGLLAKEVSHYSNDHWGDILLMWLCGGRPVPLCRIADCIDGSACSNRAIDPDVPFCNVHRCHFAGPDGIRCQHPCSTNASKFCSSHTCNFDKCLLSVVSGTIKFCYRHSCRRCIELGLPVNPAVEEPPKNVCDDHPMCILPYCENYPEDGKIHCEAHSKVGKCTATTKKGRPCRGEAVSRLKPFCRDHLHLFSTFVMLANVEDNVGKTSLSERVKDEKNAPRCAFIKKKGGRCKGPALPNAEYCTDHRSFFPPAPTPRLLQHSESGGTSTVSDQGISSNKGDASSAHTLTIAANAEDGTGTLSAEATTQLAAAKDADNMKDVDGGGPQADGGVPDQGLTLAALSLSSHSDSDVEEAAEDQKPTDPDEIEDEEDEADNLQHLRDVFEIQDGYDSDPDQKLLEDALDETAEQLATNEKAALPRTKVDPNSWTWSIHVDERWDMCHNLMDQISDHLQSVLKHVNNGTIMARNELQQAKIRAKAQMYENKSVIGGTMVGCISRLESIRATRPFAIVVEEASEVLEPLLFACLSDSTMKMEMIGDHRQLSPSLMNRYDFEILNKMNISMFQRLIEAPQGHEVPSTVLAVQRRMRKNICDLTRDFYSDIIQIEDHSVCESKVIGEKVGCIPQEATGGREVPGIAPHIFLWTHDGRQGRSHVGVSRVNQHEAEMTCALVAYLVRCRVSRRSIAVLTPYKGQLLLIRKMLLSRGLLSRNPSDQNQIRLSTVDRFQGDEEDIIICSLVVDENSKTGFVKLVNRMIVLLSRARLGLYILGNTSYFESKGSGAPPHWRKTFELLHEAAEGDAVASLVKESDVYQGTRTGRDLPLCCPVHRSVGKKASGPAELSLGFCVEICQSSLPCGHPCSVKCHWPSDTHNQACSVLLESNCERHPGKIQCSTVYKNSRNVSGITHEDIFKYYRCPNKVEHGQKCGHKVNLACWEEEQINSGQRAVPVCKKQSPTHYIFPNCGHSMSVTCLDLDTFQSNPRAAKCQETNEYVPPCGHAKAMKCFEKERITNGERMFSCNKKEEVSMPRCGHVCNAPCTVARQLETWSGESCVEIGRLIEGSTYGPPENFQCLQESIVTRKCGHELRIPCSQAFSQLGSLGPCQQEINTRHPICGHDCRIPCHQLKTIGDYTPPEPKAEFNESSIAQLSNAAKAIAGAPLCRKKVTLIRTCGHTQPMKCHLLNRPLRPCEIQVDSQSPLCGHKISLPCDVKKRVDLGCIWEKQDFKEICKSGCISTEMAARMGLTSVGTDSQRAIEACDQSINIRLPCGHVTSIECRNVPNAALDLSTIKCDEEVKIMLTCGHEVMSLCSQETLYRADRIEIVCCEHIPKKCWNFEACRRILKVPCGYEGVVACSDPIEWACSSGKHVYLLEQCGKGAPNACPNCVLDSLLCAEIKTSDFDGRDQLDSLISFVPDDCVQWFDSPDVAKYVESEREMINKFEYLKHDKKIQKYPWENPLFTMQRVPCFRVLKSKKNKKMTSFDPQMFATGGASLFGINTRPFTHKNMGALADSMIREENKTVTLLIGFVSVVKTKLYSKNRLPTDKKTRIALWTEADTEGFDSMYYYDTDGICNVISWDPFPLIALCRITLSIDVLCRGIEESSNVNNFPTVNFDAMFIEFDPPPHENMMYAPAYDDQQSKRQMNAPANDDQQNKRQRTEDDSDIELEWAMLKDDTCLKGFSVDLSWSGGIACTMLPSTAKSSLLKKMQFVNSEAAPFEGIRYLRSLMESVSTGASDSESQESSPIPELHLFMAAEYTRYDENDAQKYLKQYLDSIRGISQVAIHPWTLVVAARLNKQDALSLVAAYKSFFPTQLKILTEAEKDDGDSDTESVGSEEKIDPLQQDWEDLKGKYPNEACSDKMEELLNLTGLRKVKKETLRLWKSALQLQKMDPETRKANAIIANYCFLGNPGTGKTTVARLFAGILCDCGIRKDDIFKETTAQKVKDGGTDEFRKLVEEARGGVLFIDEAYDLDPVGDFKGKPIVNEILTLCENDRDSISLILAGYEDDFQKKFFAYNDGLKSRFREVLFEDFDEAEISKIWTEMRTSKKWEEEDGVSTVVSKRISKMAGRKGFGNAREVRKRLETATQEAMSRLGDQFSMDRMKLLVQDVIGEDPRLGSEKLQRVLEEINEKVGWKRVKENVKQIVDLCATNYTRELLGKPPLDMILNRLFLGNPGTGKTTCAVLYGRLLKELGFLSIGDVVQKVASDFVGSVVGESQNRTAQIIEGARGKVLIIDEAYNLADGLYGKQVLDSLVERVQGTPGDDIAVLLLGYEEPMLKMLRDENQGLARRFPRDHAFYFDDYNDGELLKILDLNLKKYEVSASVKYKEKALDILRTQKKQSNFGNAGAVELLVKGSMQIAANRDPALSGGDILLQEVDIEDAGKVRGDKDEDPLSRLRGLYRMDKIKHRLEVMQKAWTVARREGGTEPELGHFVFQGSPGTGKTTVARVIAEVLYSLGLKSSNKIVETSALDLTADYVGQTATKVTEALKEAKGGVLFIDEAYNLGEGIYGKEACDTIVAAMTGEEFCDVLIVIAGYPGDLNKMLNANQGLKSRFTQFFDFPDWEPDDCVAFFQNLASEEEFELETGTLDKLREGCASLKQLKGWGNGRDLKKIWEDTKQHRAVRVFDSKPIELEKLLQCKDVQKAVDSMIQARVGKLVSSNLPEGADPLDALDKLYGMEFVKTKLDRLRKTWAVARREGNVVPRLGHFVFTGSPGTGKTTVARSLSDVLFGLKLKATNKIVETSGLELTGEYLGQTKAKVTKFLDDAKGAILFIDEAYTLGQGHFSQEACDTIVAAMTSEEYQDVTIIAAGYYDDMHQMLAANEGLKSRFTHFIGFPDWTSQDCRSFFALLAKNGDISLEDQVLDAIMRNCEELMEYSGWGNGRDVKKIFDEAQSFRAERVYDKPETVRTLVLSDVSPAIADMKSSRIPRPSSSGKRRRDPTPTPPNLIQHSSNQDTGGPPKKSKEDASSMNAVETATKEDLADEMREAVDEAVDVEKDDDVSMNSDGSRSIGTQNEDEEDMGDPPRDDGVPDEDWDELQQAKEAERRLREAQKEYEEWLQLQARLEEEARERYEEEQKRLQLELEQALERERIEQEIREAREKEELRRQEIEAERKRREEAERRRQEEIRKQEAIKERLRRVGPCPAGFDWHRVGRGWRCGGGTHFVTNQELQQHFSFEV